MLRRKAIHGAAWTAAANVATAVLQVLQLVVLARLLTPADYGLVALVMVVISFAATYGDLGMSSAIVQRQQATNTQLSSVYWLTLAVGLAVALLVLAAAPLVALAFGEPRLSFLAQLATVSLVVGSVGQPFQMLLQRDLRFRTLAAADFMSAVATVAVAVGLATQGVGVVSVIWGQIAGATLRTSVFTAAEWTRWRPQWMFRRADLRGFLHFGAFQVGERTINFVGFNLDKLLLASLAGSATLGLYNVAYQLVMRPLQVVAPVVQRVVFPLFARVQSDDALLREGYLEAMRAIALTLFPLYAACAVLADPLVRVVLGPAWSESAGVVRWLAALAIFYSIGHPIGSLLLAKGRVRLGFGMNVWMILLYTAAIAIGAAGGAVRVAQALVVATALGLFPLGFWVRWTLVRLRPGPYLAAIAPPAVAAAIAAAVVVALDTTGLSTLRPLGNLVVLSGLGAIVYVVCAFPWLSRFVRRVRQTAG